MIRAVLTLVCLHAGLPAMADCDNRRPMGDWRLGTESRDEAESFQIEELANTLETYMNCLEDTMKLEGRREKNGAGSQSPTDGRDQAEDSTNRDDQRNKLEYSDSPMNEGGQPNRVAVPDVQTRENVGSSKDDSDQTKSRSDIPVTPSEIEIEGSLSLIHI